MQDKNHTDGVISAAAVLNRLTDALGAKNDSELARLLGEKRSTVGNWRNRNLPAATIIEVARRHGLSLDGLFFGDIGTKATGQRSTLPAPSLRDLEASTHGLVRLTVDAGGDPIPEDLWSVLEQRRSLASDVASEGLLSADADVLTVPFAENVRATVGSKEMVFEEAANLKVEVPRSILPGWTRARGLCCIQAADDSMAPTLQDHDVILIDRSHVEPVDGEVFVLHTSDGLLVKRLRVSANGWMMTSDNPDYRPRPVGELDRLVGRVAWSGPLPATEAHGGKKR